jgi:hypothetical protein
MDDQDKVAIQRALFDNNTSRLKQIADRKNLEDRLTPTASYLGQSDDGRSLTKSVGGSIVPLRTIGNVQPSMGAVGRAAGGGFDPGVRIQPDQRRRRSSDDGDVTILAARIVGGTTELWLGGDRRPEKIATIASTSFNAIDLELTGPLKTDWLVAIRHNNTTAQILTGNGTNWTVTDPRVGLLSYLGNGFWAQRIDPYRADPGQFANTTSAPGANASDLRNQLGTRVGSNCYSGIEGFTTVAVAYCEQYSISGPESLSSNRYNRQEGLVQPMGSPFTFTGVNVTNDETFATANIVGANTGPGYLGPGGQQVSPTDPPITGTEEIPTRQASQESTYIRNYSSTVHLVSLYSGNLSESVGTRTLAASQETQFTLSSGGTIKKLNYIGSPGAFTQPSQILWTIYSSIAEVWPSIPDSQSVSTTPIVAATDFEMAIAPGINKTNTATITAPFNSFGVAGTGNGYYSFAGNCFAGGYSWTEEVINATVPGTARTSLELGELTFDQSSRTRKTYFNWQGADIEAAGIYGELSKTWQPDTLNPGLPVANSVLLDASFQVFTKNTTATVTEYTPQMVSGKLTYQENPQTKQVKVLSMASVTGGFVQAYKYWKR